jgi:hypothetical protein
MKKILTKDKLIMHYFGILKSPLYVLDLSLSEKRQVLEYAVSTKLDLTEFISGLIETNPNYDYPTEYLPDRLFDYWSDRYENGGKTIGSSVDVIKAIDRSLTSHKKFRKLFLTSAISINDKKEKPCTSIVRARSFYLYKYFLDGRIKVEDFKSKIKFKELVSKEFVGQKGHAEYVFTLTKESLFNNFEKLKNQYIDDYDYGLKLYNNRYSI